MEEQVNCKVCFRNFDSYKALSAHFGSAHKLNSNDYYDLYLMEDDENKCIVCGDATKYVSLTTGYNKYCSRECSFVGKTKSFNMNVSDNDTTNHFKSTDVNHEVYIYNNPDKDSKTIQSEPTLLKSKSNMDENMTYFELVKNNLSPKDFKRHLKYFNSMDRERSLTIETYMKVVYKNFRKGSV